MKRILIIGFITLCALFTGFGYSSTPSSIAIGELSINKPRILGEAKVTPVKKDVIRFVGDVMLGRNVEQLMNTYGVGYPFSSLERLPSNYYLVGNFESTIPKVHVPTPHMNFTLSVKREDVGALPAYGFTHLSLANNHAYDFGIDGFENTVKELQRASTTPFGNPVKLSSENLTFLNTKNTVVAIIGVHAVYSTPTQEEIKAVLLSAKENSDVQIVYIHWGNEYEVTHSEGQKKLAYAFIDEGADVIIGHHPHVVQDIQVYKGATIFYSLGNYIFDQYFSDEVQTGLALDASFESNRVTFALVPITSIGSRSSPREMSTYEKDAFLGSLSKNSHAELASMIKRGVIEQSF